MSCVTTGLSPSLPIALWKFSSQHRLSLSHVGAATWLIWAELPITWLFLTHLECSLSVGCKFGGKDSSDGGRQSHTVHTTAVWDNSIKTKIPPTLLNNKEDVILPQWDTHFPGKNARSDNLVENNAKVLGDGVASYCSLHDRLSLSCHKRVNSVNPTFCSKLSPLVTLVGYFDILKNHLACRKLRLLSEIISVTVTNVLCVSEDHQSQKGIRQSGKVRTD